VIAKRFGILLVGVLLSLLGCSAHPDLPQLPKPKPKPTPTEPSKITVDVSPGGPAVITTSAAEFQIRPNGYVQASLIKDGHRLSLDEPRVGALSDSDYVVIGGKEVHFTSDFELAEVFEAYSKVGAGKRLEIPARPLGPSGTDLQRKVVFEAYDRYPNVLLVAVEYKNVGTKTVRIERTIDQRRRFSAKLVDAKAQIWDLWSYHRADGGNGNVVRLDRHFSRRNEAKPANAAELTGLPLVALWTGEVGEAVGDMDAVPAPAAIPVKVESDGRVDVQIEMEANAMLAPGESYSIPRSFLSVYEGDASEPVHLWSVLPKKDDGEPAKPQSPAR
jgi:hypothetical protein